MALTVWWFFKSWGQSVSWSGQRSADETWGQARANRGDRLPVGTRQGLRLLVDLICIQRPSEEQPGPINAHPEGQA